MQSLIQFPIDLSRTAAALERIADTLSGIRDALNRLAPCLPEQPEPVAATLSDLRSTAPQVVGRIRQELDIFAQERNVQLNSDAFLASVVQYEKEVADFYGPQAIMELPWNKAAGGPLFSADRLQPRAGEESRASGPQRVPHEDDDQSGAGAESTHAVGRES